MDTELEMYLDFRKHIDTLCFRNIQKEAGTGYQRIMCGEELVGFLIVINGYVDAIYVKPEYRRMGLGRDAIVNFLISGGQIKSLHILNNNEPAKVFWESLFELKEDNRTAVDTLYQVFSPKQALISALSKKLDATDLFRLLHVHFHY
jgi:GNAT superfamily N-acetyltransferase